MGTSAIDAPRASWNLLLTQFRAEYSYGVAVAAVKAVRRRAGAGCCPALPPVPAMEEIVAIRRRWITSRCAPASASMRVIAI